ncbi:MAG: T9SS type A sorting domain-containing protein [Bacteroidetes bacterium]|nr:T9SS type A sorting domain-containing protein [Bacteroidota bacterium]
MSRPTIIAFARRAASHRHLARLLLGILLAMPPAMASAGTYYFSTSGNDAWPGTSPDSAKQSLAAAAALALPGNTLLFHRGDAWYFSTGSFDLRSKAGTAANPILIDAYGVGAKPVIASLALLPDSAWTNVPGTNTWQQNVTGYSKAWRLYIGGVSKYAVNTTNSSANETSVTQPYQWYIKPVVTGSSAVVYVNTGSSTTGPARVEIQPVTATSAMLLQNTSYLTVRNLDIRGGSQYNVVYVESPSSYITFDSCYIRQAMGSGLLVTNLTSNAANYVSHITITNNVVDKVWNSYENDPKISALTGDGIFILHAVDTGLVSGNVVTNWGHVGLTLSSYEYGYHGVHHIIAEKNDVSAGASGYMHALDVDGFEGLTTYNIIRRNYFHDYTSTCHAQGSNNQYYSNIFAGVTMTTQPLEDHQPWGLDMIPWKYSDGHWMSAHDNYVVNNTIVGCAQYPIVMSDDATSTSPVDNNHIANNILYSYGGVVALNLTPNIRGSVFVRNNDMWNFSSTSATVRYKNNPPYYTAAALDSTYPAYCSGNRQLGPAFIDAPGRNFALTDSTPSSIRGGGTPAYDSLLGSGFVDYYGNAWSPDSPSMGAVQYHGAPLSIVFDSVKVYENQAAGSPAGRVSAIPADPADIISLSLVPVPGDSSSAAPFVLSGGELYTTAPLNYEQAPSYTLRVRAATSYGLFIEKNVTVTVGDVDEAPTMDPIAAQSLCQTQDVQTVAVGGLSAGPEAGQSIRLVVAADNASLFDLLQANVVANGMGYVKYHLAAGAAGVSNVTVTVIDDGDTLHGGTNSFSQTMAVTVHPNPVVSISQSPVGGPYAGNDNTLYLGYGPQQALLSASGDAAIWQWSPATGLDNAASATPVFSPSTAGSFTLTATAVSAFGCPGSQQTVVKVSDVRCGHDGKGVLVCYTLPNLPSVQFCVNPVAVPLLLSLGGQLGSCGAGAVRMIEGGEAAVKQAIGSFDPGRVAANLLVYPNPSRQATTVSFSLPQGASQATLSVFDLRGSVVRVLYRGRVDAGVPYQFVLDGSSLASGTYVVRLSTPEKVQNIKLVLVK